MPPLCKDSVALRGRKGAIPVIGEVFFAFLRLGLTAFGGPVAHIGYFRNEFVDRRKWLTDQAYADLVALCQFLPGPASSQTGLAIGLLRAGPFGALAAWVGFTLPSALLMTAAAISLLQFGDAIPDGTLAGLKAVVVAVVAQALLGMSRNLTPDVQRFAIAVFAAALALIVSGVTGQLIAIAAGALVGLVVCRNALEAKDASADFQVPVSGPVAWAMLALFLLLLFALPTVTSSDKSLAWQIADGFYRSGALVFGGGHVVLPLLQAETVQPGLVGAAEFTAGYGLAQAVPGPLFTFAAFLGGTAGLAGGTGSAVTMAFVAILMIFLPGTLLVFAALPFWADLRRNQVARAALNGVNASVVGILAAALYTPVATTAINRWEDIAIAGLAFLALQFAKLPAWSVVPMGACLGILAAQI